MLIIDVISRVDIGYMDETVSEFFDYINTGRPRLTEIDGKLCYTETMGGYLGIIESWFIGYEWDESNPRIQLEPIGERGYIELVPVKKLR